MSDESARTLRSRLRGAESDAGRLRLLEVAANALAEESCAKTALASALNHVLRFLAADSGLVLSCDGGALTVMAAQGDVLPVGARILVGGVLATVLRPPFQFVLREHIESRLRLGRQPDVALELLLPLRLGSAAHGILAIMSESGGISPISEDMQTLQAFATLISGILQRPPSARAKSSRRDAGVPLGLLTPREQQVFVLLPRGLSNAQIAEQLGIATGTAKIHVERILHKLGVSDRTQAAVRAIEWGHKV